jgi:toxin ParE1/3/4
VKPLRISPPASAEFTDAVRWYETKRLGLGAEFFDAVVGAAEFIRTHPTAAAASGRTRSWPMARFPYRLVYRIREHDIYIVAIAHTSRKPGYWKRRDT